MQTVSQREQIQVHARERFEDNRRHELATDIAERIGYPISHTVEYKMIDGMAYATTDLKNRPFRNQTAQALREGRAKYSGVNEFEYIRLGLEHEEALMADKFGSCKLDGNILIKVSRVPDAVVDGTARVRGYRRDEMRSFVRIYYMADGLMKCHLFSLDGNSSEGMAAVGALIGIDMRPGRGSEEILADHRLETISLVDDQRIEEFAENIKERYDAAIWQASGERRHAGSRFLDQKDALSVVKSKPWLLDQHDQEVARIMARSLDTSSQDALIEQSLKRTAAAVTVVERGGAVGSLSDASVDAAVQSGNFDRDCPTGAQQAESILSSMGMNQAKPREAFKSGTCRVCLKDSRVGECHVCQACENADNRGESLDAIHAAALRRKVTEQAMARHVIDRTSVSAAPKREKTSLSKSALIQQKYGKHARFTTQKTVGDALTIVTDAQGNEIDRF